MARRGGSTAADRWYSPRLGQFVSHDPLHYVDSTNLYAFAGFDPVNSWDPMGLESSDLADAPLARAQRDYWLAKKEYQEQQAEQRAKRRQAELAKSSPDPRKALKGALSEVVGDVPVCGAVQVPHFVAGCSLYMMASSTAVTDEDENFGLGFARETGERFVFQPSGGLETHVLVDGTTTVFRWTDDVLVKIWEYVP
ncbi:MAG: RHS repeat-associated core domain-containing protein [bacterium]